MPFVTCENCKLAIAVAFDDLTRVVECARCRTRFIPLSPAAGTPTAPPPGPSSWRQPVEEDRPPAKPRRPAAEAERGQRRQEVDERQWAEPPLSLRTREAPPQVVDCHPAPPRFDERPRRRKRRRDPAYRPRWDLILGVGLGLMAFLVLSVGAVLLVQYGRSTDGQAQATPAERPPRPGEPAGPANNALPAAEEDIAGWQEVVSASGRFSIQMPEQPKVIHEDNPEQHLFVCSRPHNASYSVSYGLLSGVSRDTNRLLDAACERYAQNKRGRILGKAQAIQLDEYPGRDAWVSVQDGAALAHLRIYVVGNRVYILEVLGPGDFAKSKAADHFFESFRLED